MQNVHLENTAGQTDLNPETLIGIYTIYADYGSQPPSMTWKAEDICFLPKGGLWWRGSTLAFRGGIDQVCQRLSDQSIAFRLQAEQGRILLQQKVKQAMKAAALQGGMQVSLQPEAKKRSLDVKKTLLCLGTACWFAFAIGLILFVSGLGMFVNGIVSLISSIVLTGIVSRVSTRQRIKGERELAVTRLLEVYVSRCGVQATASMPTHTALVGGGQVIVLIRWGKWVFVLSKSTDEVFAQLLKKIQIMANHGMETRDLGLDNLSLTVLDGNDMSMASLETLLKGLLPAVQWTIHAIDNSQN